MPEDYSLTSMMAGGRRRTPYDRKRALAEQMMQAGADYSPVRHPLQGAARLAQALVGGYMANKTDAEEKDAREQLAQKIADAGKIADPQERIAAYTAIDPQIGMRAGATFAVEQAKMAQQQKGLGVVADSYAPQPTGPIGAGPPLPSGQPNASGFNNNLGNLRVSGANWQGKGAPHNGFETFATPQDGANAMFQNLGAYVKAQPGITVAQAISKWAPPNENDTNLYIRQVMEATGINPAMPLGEVLQDPALAATLMDAMTRKEKGGLPQGVTADTFMTATTPRGATGQPQPLQVNMPGPGIPPQGATETNGMPPVPSPQGVQMPTMVAPPVPPQRMTPRDMPREMAAPFIDRLRRGGYGNNPAEAEQRMVANMQRALDVSFENQKLEYERLLKDYDYSRKRADDTSDREREDFRKRFYDNLNEADKRAYARMTEADKRRYEEAEYDRREAAKRADKQPQQQFDNSNKLRDEFSGSKVVQNYREVTPIMESMKEAMQRPSRAADLNMVYALAKIMDPGSVVREGEMIMVNNTQGIGDRLAGMINSLNGGAQLTPETRQRIIEEAQSRYRGLEQSYKALEDHYGGMADRFNLRREDVIVPIRKQAPTTPTSPEDLKKKYGLE